MWRFGPGVFVGILILFVTRSFTTKEVFIGIFLMFVIWDLLSGLSQKIAYLRQVISRNRSRRDIWNTIYSILSAALVIGISLVKNWPWLSPFFVWVFLAVTLGRFRTPSTGARFAIALGALGAGAVAYQLALSVRANLWWMLADDYQLFETRSWSLIEFGPRTEAVASARDGLQALAYHHGAFFLTGLVDFVTQSDQYRALTRLTPVLLAIVLVASVISLLWELSKWIGVVQAHVSLAAVGCFLLLLPISPGMFSDYVGVVAIVSSAAIACRAASRPDTFLRALLCAAAIPATALSKAPFLYASAIVLVVVILSTHGMKSKSFVGVVIACIAVVLLLRTASPLGGDLRFSPFNSYSLFELAEGSSLLRVLALAAVLAPVSLGSLVCVWMLVRSRDRGVAGLFLGLLLTILVGYGSRFLVGGRIETIRYMWQPALVATALALSFALIPGLLVKLRVLVPLRVVTLGVLLSVLFLVLTQLFVPNLNSGSVVAKLLRVLRSPDFLQLIVAASCGLILGLRQLLRVLRNEKGLISDVSIVSVLLSAGMVVGLFSQSTFHFQEIREGHSGATDAERSHWVGTPNLKEVSRYLREETDKSSLIAVTLCEYLSEGCPSEDFRFAAYSERKFLSLGGSWILYYSTDDPAALDALGSSVTGSVDLDRLTAFWRSRGVDYGVIDKALVPAPIALETVSKTEEVFSNSDYRILKLISD
jgi:hypothetical protein